MSAEIGCEREIGIERRGAYLVLEPRKVRSLVPDQGKEFLSRPVPPWG